MKDPPAWIPAPPAAAVRRARADAAPGLGLRHRAGRGVRLARPLGPFRCAALRAARRRGRGACRGRVDSAADRGPGLGSRRDGAGGAARVRRHVPARRRRTPGGGEGTHAGPCRHPARDPRHRRGELLHGPARGADRGPRRGRRRVERAGLGRARGGLGGSAVRLLGRPRAVRDPAEQPGPGGLRGRRRPRSARRAAPGPGLGRRRAPAGGGHEAGARGAARGGRGPGLDAAGPVGAARAGADRRAGRAGGPGAGRRRRFGPAHGGRHHLPQCGGTAPG